MESDWLAAEWANLIGWRNGGGMFIDPLFIFPPKMMPDSN
jgi:hypothetical protein